MRRAWIIPVALVITALAPPALAHAPFAPPRRAADTGATSDDGSEESRGGERSITTRAKRRAAANPSHKPALKRPKKARSALGEAATPKQKDFKTKQERETYIRQRIDSYTARNKASQPERRFVRTGRSIASRKPKERPARDMSDDKDRRRQILTHLSTQLYGAVLEHRDTHDREDPVVEIQAIYDSKGNLFLMANNNTTLDMLQEAVLNHGSSIAQKDKSGRNRLQQAIEKPYEKASTIPRERLKRIPSKMEALRLGTRSEQTHAAMPIYEAIAEARSFEIVNMPRDVSVNTDKAAHEIRQIIDGSNSSVNGRRVFLLYAASRDKRHAEERGADMIDLLEHASGNDPPRGANYTVAGTKRPCFSCQSRYDYERTINRMNVEFGEHSGDLYKTAVYAQRPEHAMHTLDRLETERTSISVHEHRNEKGSLVKRKIRSIESASNSEAEGSSSGTGKPEKKKSKK